MPYQEQEEAFVHGRGAARGRRVWVHDVTSSEPAVIFLDGELYLEKVNALLVLKELHGISGVAPPRAVFVSNNGAAARHTDDTCNPDYASFLCDDVVPWVGSTPTRTFPGSAS